MPAKQDQLRRVAEDMENAGERQDLAEVEEETGQRDEKNGGTEACDLARDFGEKREHKKEDHEHGDSTLSGARSTFKRAKPLLPFRVFQAPDDNE